MLAHFMIGIIFLIILAFMTFRGYIEGPAIVIPAAVSIVLALLITGVCESLFPSLYIPFVSNIGNLFGINITETQISSAQIRAYCSTGIRLAKSAFTGFIAIAAAVPSSAILYRNIYLVRKADSMFRKILRIIGALISFFLCLVVLWAVVAFFHAGANESYILASISDAFSQDRIISAICYNNPLQDAISSFVRRG